MAISAAGSRYALAKSLGLRPQTVQEWQRVPVERIIEIEQKFGVPREKMRPELYAGYRRIK